MEWFDYLRDKWNLDIIIVALVFLSGFFQEKYLCFWMWVKNTRFDASLKTLAVSFLVSSIYILIMAKELKRANVEGAEILVPWGKYFFSYFFSTSLYDMGISPLRRWIKKKFGDADEAKTT